MEILNPININKENNSDKNKRNYNKINEVIEKMIKKSKSMDLDP